MARRSSLRDVALTPSGGGHASPDALRTHDLVPASVQSPAHPVDAPSPYMTTVEAAVLTRRPNAHAFFDWARRKGLRALHSGLWSRAEVVMAIEGRGHYAKQPAGRRGHALSLARVRRPVHGPDVAKRAAKVEPSALAVQLRTTLLRAGHTEACLDAMTDDESRLQSGDRARAEQWCQAHGCRLHYRRLQFPTLVPSSAPAGERA